MPDPNNPASYGPYGDAQSQMTMNRAAYGNIPAAMMSGAGTVYGGAGGGINNMFSQLGSNVFPTVYTPPARVWVGYGGMYTQSTGLIRGMFGQIGLESVPRGTTHLEHAIYTGGDIGERVGVGAAAAGTTLAGLAFGMTAGGAIGGFLGGAAGSIFGPVGTAAGAFLGRELGGYAMGMAGSNAITGAIGQRRDIEGFLEAASFRFTGAGNPMADPRLGGGMSRDARRQTAEFIRSRDIADPFLNTQELTQILQGGTQMGLFSGTHDMEDFQKKFKGITESVKQVTRLLHQTLDEGLKTIKELRGIGVDPSQAGTVAQQADMMGRMAGKTGTEMINLGLQGADIFRGTGVNMGIAFQATMMNNASIRAARDAGMIAQETIAQAGGEEALAQRMTAGGMAFSQSAFGRGFNAAFFNPGMGPAGFNQSAFMSNVFAGGGNFVQNAQAAAMNLGSPAALIKYEANQEKFLSEMGKTFGGLGLQMAQGGAAMSQAQFLAQSTGASTRDSFQLVLKQMGMGRPEIDAMLGKIEGAGAIFQSAQASTAATRDKMIVEEASQNFIFNRLGARVGDMAKSVVDTAARPLNRFIDSTADAFVRFKEEQVYGVQRASIGDVDLSVVSGGMRAAGGAAIRANLDRGGLLARTAGSNLADAIRRGDFAGIGVTGSDLHAGQDVTLRSSMFGEQGISREVLGRLEERARRFSMTVADAEAMDKSGRLDGVGGRSLGAALLDSESNLASSRTAEQLGEAVFGAGKGKAMSPEQVAKLTLMTRGTSFEGIINQARESSGIAMNASNAVFVDELKTVKGRFDTTKARMAQIAGGEFAKGAAERLAAAGEAEASGNKDYARQLREEAANIQLHAGTDPAKAKAMIKAADSSDFKMAAHDLSITMGQLAEVQSVRGSSTLASAMRSELGGARFDDIKNRDQINSIIDRVEIGGLKAVADDDAKILDKAGLGAGVLGMRKNLASLDTALKSGKVADIRRALRGTGIDNDKIEALAAQAGRGNIQGVMSAVESELNNSIAGTSAASAAGGSNLDKTGGQANAQQQAALQTNINLQVLSALQAMAAKLGPGGK